MVNANISKGDALLKLGNYNDAIAVYDKVLENIWERK